MVTDEDTIFATLIMQSAAAPDVELYPRPLMRWSERLYAHVFNQYGQFSLQENGQLLWLLLLPLLARKCSDLMCPTDL